jgi:hypothetical protein
MHADGDDCITDLTELFSISRPPQRARIPTDGLGRRCSGTRLTGA